MSTSRPASLCVIGVGPRGTSVLERLRAEAPAWASAEPWELHLVDAAEFGAGRVWRTDQTRELCMNTFAGAVTLFTDTSVNTVGPIVEGPTMFEWCMLVLDGLESSERSRCEVERISPARRERFAEQPVRDRVGTRFLDELRGLRPESHPSRALYGEYLVWCFDRAVASLPGGAQVREYRERAVRIERIRGRERVTLASGRTIECDAVILAGGWIPRLPSPADRELELAVAGRAMWIRQGSPVEQDLSGVAAGEPVIVRGLGMGFFDSLALLTIGRGGRFEETDSGRLRYLATGREPIVHVTSNRGVPFRSKSVYRSLPPAAAHRHFRGVDWSRMPRPLDFDRDVWPLIVRDGYDAYYRTLAEVRPEVLPHGLDPITSAIDAWDGESGGLDATIAPFVTRTDDRFELADLIDPAASAGPFTHPGAFDAWVHEYLERDLDEADAGTRSPLKAALWSIGAARKAVAELIAFDGLFAESFRGGYRNFVSLGGMIGSGPPAFRTRQLLALADVGLVHFIGPCGRVGFDEREGRFVARSPTVADSDVAASVLIDAWMHLPDLSRASDELVVGLREQGRMRPHVRHASDGTPHPTAAIDVDPETSRLIAADGSVDPAVIVIGIPLDESRGDTIISPMPGANSTMLRETDRAAAAAYETLTEARRRAAA